MKNTLKRILLLLPVISVLLVALAVPVFADATDGGYIEPVTFNGCLYYVESSVQSSVDVTLGSPYSLGTDDAYIPTLLIDVDVGSLSGYTVNIPSDHILAINLVMTSGSVRNAVVDQISNAANTFAYYVESVGGNSVLISVSHNQIQSLRFLCSEDILPYLTYIDYTVYTLSVPSSDSVTSVWTEIMTWITSALNSVMGAFYVDGSLTLLGTLAVIGVSVGIGFLLIGLIQRFLHLRG